MWNFPNEEDTAIYKAGMYSPTSIVGVRLLVHYSTRDTPYIVTKDKIISSNLSVLSQATNTNAFGIGAAFIDTLDINVALDAPGIKGATKGVTQFTLEAGYGTTKDNIKYVPIGVYRMQDRSCSRKNGYYTLKLQSFMAALDKNVPSNIKVSGTVKDILSYLCSKVYIRNVSDNTKDIKLYLSSKMTDSYIASLPNSNISFTINKDTGYTTYRDILKDIAVISCSFATFDNDGGLLLVPFQNHTYVTSEGIVDSIPQDQIISFAENIDNFNVEEIRCVLEDNDGNKVDYGYPLDVDKDYNIDISSTRILKTLESKDVANQISTSIYERIGSDNGYSPRPFDIKTRNPDFRLRVGDWVEATDILKDDNGEYIKSKAQIMKISYSVPGSCTYSSFTNPTNNDNNATYRSSYTPTGSSKGGSGTTVVDQTGQWHFNT